MAIIFDLDGTLVDTAPDFFATINGLRAQQRKAPLDKTVVANIVNSGADAMTSVTFDVTTAADKFDDYKNAFLKTYADNLGLHSIIYPGLAELIKQLSAQQLAWGIATNKQRRFAAPLIKYLLLEPDCLICGDDVEFPKPHPQMLLNAAHSLATPAQQCIYIGDHLRDIEAGRNAGMKTVAAAFGYIEQNSDVNQWGADYIVKNSLELVELLSSRIN